MLNAREALNRLRLPYFKHKRYLTGIDWLVQALDAMTRRATGIGNLSQIVLELEGSPNEARLRGALEAFLSKFPVVRGYTTRCINLAPYWKIPAAEGGAPAALRVHDLAPGWAMADVLALLERGVNRPFEGKREHLAFRLVRAGETSWLAMAFDHRLFDAWGAEAFLNEFQREWETGAGASQPADLPEPAHLSRWGDKFEAGKRLNRSLLELSVDASPCGLPLPSGEGGAGLFRFRTAAFDERETAAITETAYREAGYLMAMPWAAAVSARVLHRLFTQRGVGAGDVMMSVSIDMRPAEKRLRDVFFNHLSFLLFRIGASAMDDFPGVVIEVKRQMYEQVKSGFPGNLRETCFLMRIAPLPLMGWVMRAYLKGRLASFCFSHVSESAYSSTRLMDWRVRNLFHMPRVPAPPGVGIFFNRRQGRLNATLSYLEGLMSEEEADGLMRDLTAGMGV
jgi:hypothetical protein